MTAFSKQSRLWLPERFIHPGKDDLERAYRRHNVNILVLEKWAEDVLSLGHTHDAAEAAGHDEDHEDRHRDGGDDELSLDHLATSAAEDLVATDESRTSTSYGDLATAGPTVTLTPGASGVVLASLYASARNQTDGQATWMAVDISDGNTVAAADTKALKNNNGQRVGASATFIFTGLAAASTTFQAKYRVGGGTGDWEERRLTVIPI